MSGIAGLALLLGQGQVPAESAVPQGSAGVVPTAETKAATWRFTTPPPPVRPDFHADPLPGLRQLMDTPLRDTSICRGPGAAEEPMNGGRVQATAESSRRTTSSVKHLTIPRLVAFLSSVLAMGTPPSPAAAAGGRFDVVREGQPACAIMIAERPSPAAWLAALELQSHVLKITGVELPLRRDTEPTPGARILMAEAEAGAASGIERQGDNRFVVESANLVQWTNPRREMGFGPANEFDHGGCVIAAFLCESYDVNAPCLLKPRDGKYWPLTKGEFL
jgi:hypothetical protein